MNETRQLYANWHHFSGAMLFDWTLFAWIVPNLVALKTNETAKERRIYVSWIICDLHITYYCCLHTVLSVHSGDENWERLEPRLWRENANNARSQLNESQERALQSGKPHFEANPKFDSILCTECAHANSLVYRAKIRLSDAIAGIDAERRYKSLRYQPPCKQWTFEYRPKSITIFPPTLIEAFNGKHLELMRDNNLLYSKFVRY